MLTDLIFSFDRSNQIIAAQLMKNMSPEEIWGSFEEYLNDKQFYQPYPHPIYKIWIEAQENYQNVMYVFQFTSDNTLVFRSFSKNSIELKDFLIQILDND